MSLAGEELKGVTVATEVVTAAAPSAVTAAVTAAATEVVAAPATETKREVVTLKVKVIPQLVLSKCDNPGCPNRAPGKKSEVRYCECSSQEFCDAACQKATGHTCKEKKLGLELISKRLAACLSIVQQKSFIESQWTERSKIEGLLIDLSKAYSKADLKSIDLSPEELLTVTEKLDEKKARDFLYCNTEGITLAEYTMTGHKSWFFISITYHVAQKGKHAWILVHT